MKDSEYKEFYFFGAGAFGSVDLISDKKNKPVVSYIREFIKFDKLVLASNTDLLQYKWKFKDRKKASFNKLRILNCFSVIHISIVIYS